MKIFIYGLAAVAGVIVGFYVDRQVTFENATAREIEKIDTWSQEHRAEWRRSLAAEILPGEVGQIAVDAAALSEMQERVSQRLAAQERQRGFTDAAPRYRYSFEMKGWKAVGEGARYVPDVAIIQEEVERTSEEP